jgi:pyruvate/2-oxoglutarate/acetoin dehydrogenase E1 component
MTEKTLIEGIREALDEELARDDRVFITGEDVGRRRYSVPRWACLTSTAPHA